MIDHSCYEMPFGKYKGTQLKHIPASYALWAGRTLGISEITAYVTRFKAELESKCNASINGKGCFNMDHDVVHEDYNGMLGLE